ncbi:DUF7448 domain-containing protein [Acidovorax sp. M14]|uniref:DUF7448 domain-containing protein n=1 Tax=Acidovorax sp. M14 TaxID=3411354 RepID=UPI003BF45EA3
MSEYIPWEERKDAKFSDLLGATLAAIEGLEKDSEFVVFKTADGREFFMLHDQSCCESVSIESVVGDVADLIGHPLLVAEESSSSDTPEGFTHEYEPESQTWTFYKLATIKGYIDLRWFGSSNGYYSERVDFFKRTRNAE